MKKLLVFLVLFLLLAGCGHPVTLGLTAWLLQQDEGEECIIMSAEVDLTITTSSLPYAVNGVDYNQTVQAVGGSLPYTWSITANNLPSGVVLDTATGILSGTPSDVLGDFSFTVQVVDSNAESATELFTITLYDKLQITYTPPLPDAENGKAYGPETITATGGTGNLTWSISAGTLPSGISLATDNGQISGIPDDAAASYSFTITVQDDAAPQQTDTLDIALNLFDTLTIVTTSLPDVVNGVVYNATLNAVGGTGNYTWSEAGFNLPAGLSITADGIIQGTASDTTGLYDFTVQVDDDGSPQQTDIRGLSFDLYDQLQITTSAALPDAMEDTAYSETPIASGGNGFYTWSNPTSDIPAWLILDPITGEISGTPPVGSSSGSPYTFTIRVEDSASPPQADEVIFSLAVLSEIIWEDTFDNTDKIDNLSNISMTTGYARLTENSGIVQPDASYSTSDTTPAHDFGDTTWIAQTFTVLTSGRLTFAQLYHCKNIRARRELTLEIRNVVGGQPGPEILATTSLFLARTDVGNWVWRDTSFTAPIDVWAGQTFALVCRGTGSITDHSGTSDASDPYDGGAAFISTDSGDNWNPVVAGENCDLGFCIYVTPFNTFNTPGTLESVDIASTPLSQWTEIAWNADVPANTSVTIQVLYDSGGGNWVLIPDGDLTDNSTGFVSSPVDISGLDTGTYPAIRLRATLAATDNTVTPKLLDWQVGYKP